MGNNGQMANNSHVEEHSSVTKKCFIAALKSVYSTPVNHLIMTLCNEDFPPPVGLPLHNPDSLRISQSFIYGKNYFCRMNSVIKHVFHCIILSLTNDWTVHVSFSSYFSSIMKTISILRHIR